MSESDCAVQDFAEAARWVTAVVGEIPADRWGDPGLGEWDLRSLVGHTSRALLTARVALTTAAGVAALQLSANLAARGGHGVDLLLAATGRRPLPAGFSVLQPKPGAYSEGSG